MKDFNKSMTTILIFLSISGGLLALTEIRGISELIQKGLTGLSVMILICLAIKCVDLIIGLFKEACTSMSIRK